MIIVLVVDLESVKKFQDWLKTQGLKGSPHKQIPNDITQMTSSALKMCLYFSVETNGNEKELLNEILKLEYVDAAYEEGQSNPSN